MPILKKILILVFPPLFFIGLWWGLRETKLQHEKQGQFGPMVKIQLLKGSIPESALSVWSRQAKVTLEPEWIENTRDLLAGYENPTLDILTVPSFHAHPAHISDLLAASSSNALKSVRSQLFVDFLFEPTQSQMLSLVPFGWDIQTLFCPKSMKWNPQQTISLGQASQLSGSRVRIRQNASELIAILLRSKKIQPEWITPEQSDLLKSEITQMKNQFEIVQDMQVLPQQNNCWFDSLSSESKYKDFAMQLWTEEEQSLWIYYLGLKNADKQELYDRVIEAYYSKEMQKLLENKTNLFSPLKESLWPPSQDSRRLENIQLSHIKILRGQPEGETIWDKVVELALENQPAEGDSSPSHEGVSTGDD